MTDIEKLAQARVALKALVLSLDCLQSKLDPEDPDVIAARMDMDDAEAALATLSEEE